MNFPKRISNLDWRFLFKVISPFFLLLLLTVLANITDLHYSNFSHFSNINALFSNKNIHFRDTTVEISKEELNKARVAVCLVGGARRFELTGPSIVEHLLKPYPNWDLFLNSPLDQDSFKFSLLKNAPRLVSVRIFRPNLIREIPMYREVFDSWGSPRGLQGLLQYFSLVEGCFNLVKSYQEKKNFTYDWIVRTRVDGYWTGPLDPIHFVRGHYVIPSGSSYGGANDRLGTGDFNTSVVAFSRFSLIPKLHSEGFRRLNSEKAFKAQLTTHGVPYTPKRIPFCVLSDRRIGYPPGPESPVVALSSSGPLSGAYCRPCTPICKDACVPDVMKRVDEEWRDWSWTDWKNETFALCDGRRPWERGWEDIFDKIAGQKFVLVKKRVSESKFNECVNEFEEMKRKTIGSWEVPAAAEICGARPH